MVIVWLLVWRMSDNNAMVGSENVDYKNVYQLNVSSPQCCACFSNNSTDYGFYLGQDNLCFFCGVEIKTRAVKNGATKTKLTEWQINSLQNGDTFLASVLSASLVAPASKRERLSPFPIMKEWNIQDKWFPLSSWTTTETSIRYRSDVTNFLQAAPSLEGHIVSQWEKTGNAVFLT